MVEAAAQSLTPEAMFNSDFQQNDEVLVPKSCQIPSAPISSNELNSIQVNLTSKQATSSRNTNYQHSQNTYTTQ